MRKHAKQLVTPKREMVSCRIFAAKSRLIPIKLPGQTKQNIRYYQKTCSLFQGYRNHLHLNQCFLFGDTHLTSHPFQPTSTSSPFLSSLVLLLLHWVHFHPLKSRNLLSPERPRSQPPTGYRKVVNQLFGDMLGKLKTPCNSGK